VADRGHIRAAQLKRLSDRGFELGVAELVAIRISTTKSTVPPPSVASELEERMLVPSSEMMAVNSYKTHCSIWKIFSWTAAIKC
jgi:hypothetical protein